MWSEWSTMRGGNFSYEVLRFSALTRANSLLPLNRSGRLRCIVVHHAVDALHFVDDAGSYAAEKVGVEGIDIGRHAVERGHCAQSAHIVIGAIITHDADGAHRQKHCERLPDGVVQAGIADLFEIHGVGLPEDVALFVRDLAGYADGEAGAGERVPADERFGQPQLAAAL